MEGHVLTPDEEVQEAMRILEKYRGNRGDSFDIGGEFREVSNSKDLITNFLSNPRQLANSLNLTSKQAENIRSLIVGGGAGGVHKLLSQHLGDEVAGMVGGLISGWIAKKIIGR